MSIEELSYGQDYRVPFHLRDWLRHWSFWKFDTLHSQKGSEQILFIDHFLWEPFLAKYLDVCETTATTTHILQTTSRVLINIVLNWGQSVGGLHRQGVYYAVCWEQERELVTVTTTEQREAPGPPGKRGWWWCLECELISTVNTGPVEH